MLGSFSHSIRADLAQLIVRKFGRGSFLVIGANAKELARQFDGIGVPAAFCNTGTDLPAVSSKNGVGPNLDLAIWFYAPGQQPDEALVQEIAARAKEVIVITGLDPNAANRRPSLVEYFYRSGLSPDYASDLGEIDPTALRLVRKVAGATENLVPAMESAIARLTQHARGLERTLGTRVSELEAADRHITRLEEKLLKLKEAKRDLKKLKQEKQALRKSPERKIGQVVLAPYRLPQKLIREVKKRLPSQGKTAPASDYQKWLQNHVPSKDQVAAMRQESKGFVYQPLVTIITPVFNSPPAWLTECVESVLRQAYEKWQLILVDDASTLPETLQALKELAARDSRILVAATGRNGGISVATNQALSLAQGEWVGFLDHDDLLEPDALFQNVKLLQDHRDTDLIYSDEDKLTEDGFDSPSFKPDWSPDFFLSYNYLCHFVIVRRALVEKVGGFRPKFDGAQDYDLLLRIVEGTNRIRHVARVLYHWRRSAKSTADNIRRKPGSLEAGRAALEEHLQRQEVPGHVTIDWRTHAYWVKRELIDPKKISIIIPVRDRVDLLSRCLDSLISKTNYPNYEIVLVDNDSQSSEARAYFSQLDYKIIRYGGPFNYSAINNFAVEQTDGPWLLFLNNDTELIDPDWLTLMAEQIQRPEVGAAGPRLLYPDNTVQHAGIVLGVGGIAGHAFSGFPAESPGVSRQLQTTRNYSAVTGACLMTRRDVFNQVGGFDERQLPVTFNDVDLCLKIGQAGYRVVYVPFSTLYHHESATRRLVAEPRETAVMEERWGNVLVRDPYYNPNLSRERADFSLGK